MEQLAARRAHNPEATGSNPVPATNKNPSKKKLEGFFRFHYNLSSFHPLFPSKSISLFFGMVKKLFFGILFAEINPI